MKRVTPQEFFSHPAMQAPRWQCPGCKQTFAGRRTHSGLCATCREAQAKAPYFQILERDNFRCIYCGRSSVEDGVKLTLDHIHPHALGGKDEAGNLVTACLQCNSSKSKKVLEDAGRIAAEVARRNARAGIAPNQAIKMASRQGKK